MLLNEMANLSQDITGLNEIIWVDTNKTYINGGHFKRLKVEIKNGNKKNYISYSLIDGTRFEPKGIAYGKKDLPKDERAITNFIFNNQENLLKLSDAEITLDEFLKNLHKLNESLIDNYSPNDQEKIQNNFVKDCYSHLWEDNLNLLEDEEMNYLFNNIIWVESNSKELQKIYDLALDKYIKKVNINSIIDDTIVDCFQLVDKVTKDYQENKFPLDEIDIYALAEYTARLLLGYEI